VTLDRLTKRQRDCVSHAIKGLTNVEIGGILDLSPTTVKVHIQASFKRLGVNSRTELVWLVLTLENERLRAEVAELIRKNEELQHRDARTAA
jgi:DNA-binding CsgD family transcriptional regulator